MRQLALALLLTTISACALRQPTADWEADSRAVLDVKAWEFAGRMAVKSEGAAQGDGQLSIRWQQEADLSLIRLSGPLGAGAWQLSWSPEAITIDDGTGERSAVYTGPDAAEQFMRSELGWAFPADSIRYWVRGVPDPAAPSQRKFDAEGRLAVIEQHGWRIEIARYREADGLMLPAKLTLTGRDVRLRLAISRWRVKKRPEV